MDTDLFTRIFISSCVYGLEDLRAALASKLRDLHCLPIKSDDSGFPVTPGVPPYAACLPVLESCNAVVAVIDQKYGEPFPDWGSSFLQYNGLSPVHGEIKHAINKDIQLWVFVRNYTYSHYTIWRKNPQEYSSLDLPRKTDEKSLEMLNEIKNLHPAPWTVEFADVTNIMTALTRRFAQELQRSFTAPTSTQIATSTPTILAQKTNQFAAIIVEGLGKNGQILQSSTDINNGTSKQLSFMSGSVVDLHQDGKVVVQKTGPFIQVKSTLSQIGVQSKLSRRNNNLINRGRSIPTSKNRKRSMPH